MNKAEADKLRADLLKARKQNIELISTIAKMRVYCSGCGATFIPLAAACPACLKKKKERRVAIAVRCDACGKDFKHNKTGRKPRWCPACRPKAKRDRDRAYRERMRSDPDHQARVEARMRARMS